MLPDFENPEKNVDLHSVEDFTSIGMKIVLWKYNAQIFCLFTAFLPAPVLYGKAIDTTCILWGEKCGKAMACQYYDLDTFRHR